MDSSPGKMVLFAGVCSLIIVAVSIAGCTSGTGPVTPTASATPLATAATTSLASTTISPTQASASAAATTTMALTATQSPDPVTLTINSATKQTKVYTMVPKAGKIFLVLDITVKNNGLAKGLDLTDNTLSLVYAKAGTSPVPSLTSQLRGGLDNPILMPTTINQNDSRTGQVVFSVADGSGRYTINILGSDGSVVASASLDLR